MAINLVESIQKNLGFHELQKIDPNTQDVKKPEEMSVQDYLPQAAIPVVLLGLYKYSRTEDGNAELLKGELQNKLLKTILGNKTQQVIDMTRVYVTTLNHILLVMSGLRLCSFAGCTVRLKD